MKYDDASWHYGGDFPSDLPNDAGATHIGMFLAWCLLNSLGGEIHNAKISKLRKREVTPGQFLIAECDGKLTDEDLSIDGNAFASAYYESEIESFSFLSDFRTALNSGDRLPSDYHVADTWDNYGKLEPAIGRAYEAWRKRRAEVVSPAQRFYSLCEQVARALKPLGYRYAKSGPRVTKRVGAFSCRLEFQEIQRFQCLDIVLEVRSRQLKTWREAQGIPDPHDTVMLGGMGLLLGHERREGWSVTISDAEAKILDAIREEVVPVFGRFLNTEEFFPDVVALQIPGWDLMQRVEFLLCFGGHDQARQAAINWLQKNIGLFDGYVSHFRNYRGEGLVPYKGAGYAQELAHASHVFGFGDLSRVVTPERSRAQHAHAPDAKATRSRR